MKIKIEGVDPEMIANNILPSAPIHPGEILKDEIESRGITQKALAEQIGLAPSVLNEVLNGKRAMTIEYALLLHVVQSNPSFMKRLAGIRRIAAL